MASDGWNIVNGGL